MSEEDRRRFGEMGGWRQLDRNLHPETPLGSPAMGFITAPDSIDLKPGTVWEDVPMPSAPAASPELTAAMAETRVVRDGYARLCEEFTDSPQSGMSARISLTVLNRHRVAAGLPALSRSRDRDREDTMMRYRRERDEAREQLAETRAEREAAAGTRDVFRQRLGDAQAALDDAGYGPGPTGAGIRALAAERDELLETREEREQLCAQLAAVRRIVLQGGQSGESVRRELITWLESQP